MPHSILFTFHHSIPDEELSEIESTLDSVLTEQYDLFFSTKTGNYEPVETEVVELPEEWEVVKSENINITLPPYEKYEEEKPTPKYIREEL